MRRSRRECLTSTMRWDSLLLSWFTLLCRSQSVCYPLAHVPPVSPIQSDVQCGTGVGQQSPVVHATSLASCTMWAVRWSCSAVPGLVVRPGPPKGTEGVVVRPGLPKGTEGVVVRTPLRLVNTTLVVVETDSPRLLTPSHQVDCWFLYIYIYIYISLP